MILNQYITCKHSRVWIKALIDFMFEVREKPQLVERALLVGVYLDKSKEKEASSLLDELNELVQTLGIGIMDSVLVKVRENFPSHLMG